MAIKAGHSLVYLVDYHTGLWEKYWVTEDWSQSTNHIAWNVYTKNKELE